MKNKLIDLNNHLFAQLERLSDEDMSKDELEREIERTKAITSISDEIIKNAAVSLKAAALMVEHGPASVRQHIPMIAGKVSE